MRQQPVRGGDGLRALHVRVGGHEHVPPPPLPPPPQLGRQARVLAGLRDERAGVVVADDARAQRLHAPTPAFAGVTPAFAGTTPAALGTFAFATAAASACAASSWSLMARTRCDRP